MISSTMPTGTGYDARRDDSRLFLAALADERLVQVRAAQGQWSAVAISKRLSCVRKFRQLLADDAQTLCEMASRIQDRPQSEILTSEIFPLIAACKFLELNAASLLAPRRLGKSGLPIWLQGVTSEVHRDPYGVVLIIGPVNYSISLPGIQLLQALVSGNGVLLKPGPGGTHTARALLQLLGAAGFAGGLVGLLPESVEAATAAISAGVDKVVFTGSATAGAKVLADLAPQLVPATMELSGCDAMLVRKDADLELVTKALRFSLNLNSGATCIAPHRLIVAESRADELELRLRDYFAAEAHWRLTAVAANRVLPALTDALARGARFLSGAIEPDGNITAPVILTGVPPDCRVFRDDIFGPLVAMLKVKDDEEAIRRINDGPYGLGASIFTADESVARAIAMRLRVGLVTVNDVIVPAGDPRIPIGGRRRSGFGQTRGREGLLDLTVPKVVAVRRGRFRPHLAIAAEEETALLYAYLKLIYARGAGNRWLALVFLARSLFERRSIRPGP
jgi:acyl-CoA reductase-like NAD-dependent aldehyde dehydrogenase